MMRASDSQLRRCPSPEQVFEHGLDSTYRLKAGRADYWPYSVSIMSLAPSVPRMRSALHIAAFLKIINNRAHHMGRVPARVVARSVSRL
jgi:hypothetical protein